MTKPGYLLWHLFVFSCFGIIICFFFPGLCSVYHNKPATSDLLPSRCHIQTHGQAQRGQMQPADPEGPRAVQAHASNLLIYSLIASLKRTAESKESRFGREALLKPCDRSTHNFIWCWPQGAGLRVWTRSGCRELFIQLHLCACVCACLCVRTGLGVFLYLLDQDLVRQLAGPRSERRPPSAPLTELPRSVGQLFRNIGERA